MPKATILDEILLTFDTLVKSDVPILEIYSHIKKNRDQNDWNVGDFNCLKSYIQWSILYNSGGREKNFFTMKVDDEQELVQRNTD